MAGRKHTALFVITAVLLCFAVLGSFLFIAANAEHNCTHGDSCAVCRMIDAHIHSVRSMLAVTAAVIGALVTAVIVSVLYRTAVCFCPATLISLKTELRN